MEEVKTRFDNVDAPDRFLDRCIEQGVPLRIDLNQVNALKLHKHFHFVDYIGLSSWYCQAYTDIMQSVFFRREDNRRPDREYNVEDESSQMAYYIQSKLPKVVVAGLSCRDFQLNAFYNIACLGIGMGNRVSLENMLILNSTQDWRAHNDTEGRLNYLRDRINTSADYDLNILRKFAEKLNLQIPEMIEVEKAFASEKHVGIKFVNRLGRSEYAAVQEFQRIHKGAERTLELTGYAGRVSTKTLEEKRIDL